MKYILALDQGTTSSRAVLIGENGDLKASSQKEFTQHFPSPGLVEHDPLEIWTSQASCITEVLLKGEVSPKQIGAIGITNQRETTIVWDRKTGKPLMNAIVWQDRRTTKLCQTLKYQGNEPLIRKKTGLLLDPYFSGTKLHWILNTIPGALERAKKRRARLRDRRHVAFVAAYGGKVPCNRCHKRLAHTSFQHPHASVG